VSVCLKLHTHNFQYISVGRSTEILWSPFRRFAVRIDRVSLQMTTGLIMAFQLRSRAQIFSHYLSSRRVTEKFRCSTCLLRTPHCVTVNSSRLHEHPRHNRVVQHTWTVDISALARLLNTGRSNRDPTNPSMFWKEESRRDEKIWSPQIHLSTLLYLC